MEKKNKKKLFVLVAVVLILAVIVIISLKKNDVKTIEVQTEKLKTDKITATVNASGYLEPVLDVKVSANVSARIINLTVEEGDVVKEGQLLVELDRARYEAAYEMALSTVQSSEANLKKVKSELKRLQALYKRDLTSEAELETIQAQVEIAESQVTQANASLKQAKDDLDKTHILAPIDGIVTSLKKEKGEIALGSTFQEDVILVVSDMSKMLVRVEVDETDVVDINLGDTAHIEIDAIPDTVFTGLVSEIAHSANIQNQGTQEQVTNFEVEVSMLGADKRFRPGMSSTVDIITDVRPGVVALPIQCLTKRRASDEGKEDNEQEIVFIVHHPDSTEPASFFNKKSTLPFVRQQPVKVGISSDSHFEIISGLNEGDEVVTGSYKAISKELQDSSFVTVKTAEQKGKGEKR